MDWTTYTQPTLDAATNKWFIDITLPDGKVERHNFDTEQEAKDMIQKNIVSALTSEIIELTPEQEKILLETWNKNPNTPPTFPELGLVVFKIEGIKGTDKYGRALKKALAKHNLKAKSKAVYESRMSKIELSEEDKLFITNNAEHMKPVDMARVLFKNPALTNLNVEVRVVADFSRNLDAKITRVTKEANDVPKEDYRPPKNLEQVLKRVNSCINDRYERERMTAKQRKDMEILIENLHNRRLVTQINNYSRNDDRVLFEDSFIRYTYDKPDLAQEEIDQYIMLGHEVVNSFKIQRRIEHLQNLLEDSTAQADAPDRIKVSMSLVESINSAQNEYDDCVKRQHTLFSDLNGKRSKRIEKREAGTGSILNIFQAWKEEETRRDFIEIAKKEQVAVAEEVERLTSMDEIRAKLLGMTRNDILEG